MAHSTKGFASLTPAQRKIVSTKGGKAAQAKGVAHKWTSDEARAAGRLSATRKKARA